MDAELKASYRHCAHIARHAASSFYFSFYLLPREKRRSMFALYAFLRATDDLADGDEPRRMRVARLESWREQLQAAIAGDPQGPLFPALVDTLRRHNLPAEPLFAVIDGCELDLQQDSIATFAELEAYCHLVASAVGIACIHIWGFSDPAAICPANDCGVAFQLTNILRDLREDTARGRIYLPQEDLERFGYQRRDMIGHVINAPFRKLIDFQIDRARTYYRRASELTPYLSDDGRRVFGAMFDTYSELLSEVTRRRDDLLKH
ncbi:MAG: squalene/phytoene synthase family protein, partial [Planctomycetales bacterium]|nr:squalene/phytoene synthase family protein [Planctomycetales bacterium]